MKKTNLKKTTGNDRFICPECGETVVVIHFDPLRHWICKKTNSGYYHEPLAWGNPIVQTFLVEADSPLNILADRFKEKEIENERD